MTRFFGFVLRHPAAVLAALAVFTALCTVQALRLEVRNSVDSLMLKDRAAYREFRAFLDDFGSEEFVVVAWAVEGLTPRTLARIDRLTRRLETLDAAWPDEAPLVAQVISLTNLPDPRPAWWSPAGAEAGGGLPLARLPAPRRAALLAALLGSGLPFPPPDAAERRALLSGDDAARAAVLAAQFAAFADAASLTDWRALLAVLRAHWPEALAAPALYPARVRAPEDPALDAFYRRVRTMPTLRGLLFSADERTAAIVVRAHSLHGDDARKAALADRVHAAADLERDAAVAAGEPAPHFRVVGPPAFVAAFQRTIGDELLRFLPISLAVLAGALLLLTRSLRGVAVPLIAVVAGLAATMALIETLGFALNVSSTIIPPVLLTIGIANVVHIMEHLQEQRRRTGAPLAAALLETMNFMWVPCALTSITTAVGFASLAVSGVQPIREAGLFIAAGVMITFVLTMALVPALLLLWERLPGFASYGAEALVPRPFDGAPGRPRRRARLAALLALVETLVRRRGRWVLAATALAVAGCAWAIPRLAVETFLIKYFREDTPIVQDHRFVEERLAGVAPLEIVVRGAPGAFAEGAALAAVARLHEELETEPKVQRVTSVAGVAREFFGGAAPAADTAWRPLLALLTAPEGRAQGRTLITEDLSAVHLSLRQRDQSSHSYAELQARNEERFARLLAPLGLAAVQTGTAKLFYDTADVIVIGQVESLGLALGVISLLLLLLFRSVKLGLVALVPNLVPIALLLSCMGATGIPLNISTCMIASIAIGIAVDDTIHYLARFRREFPTARNYHEANARVLRSAGRPMVMASVILCCGFGVLVFSYFMPNVWMGVLTAVTMGNALLGDLLLLPVLLAWLKPLGPPGGAA